MERSDYETQIRDLKETNSRLLEMIKTLQLTVDSLNASNRRNEELVKNLLKQVSDLQKMIADLEDRNRRHNRNTYGKKSHKAKKSVDDKPSREEEKDNYDGSHDSPSSCCPDENNEGEALDVTKVKSEHLDKSRGPRGPYTKMDAAKIVTLHCDISNLPGGMRFVCFKDVEEYNKISYVECVCYQVAVLEDEFGNRHDYFVPVDENKAAGRRPHLNVMPGTHGTLEFLADLAVDRFQLLVPNYREGIRMKIDKFTSCDNTRLNWLKKGAEWLKPLLGKIKIRLLKPGSFLNVDETWERVRIKVRGDGTELGHYFKKYIWVLINKVERMAYFLYDNDENDSRGRRPLETFLGDFKGSIMSDAFIVYKQLTLDHPDLLHCLCWAHVYNNFDDALVISGEKDVTDTLLSLHTLAGKLLRKKGGKYSALMLKALNYMLNGWNELLNYRKDGRFTIDNLPAERAIRPVTVSRKNSLHYSSEEGLQVALTYMTIIETVKMLGMDAKDFLVRAWHEAIYGGCVKMMRPHKLHPRAFHLVQQAQHVSKQSHLVR